MTPLEISLRVLLQLAVILTACRIVGRLVRPLGQPQVVAEMITGVLLGPSLLGAIAPGAQDWLFPSATRPVLQVLAHLGLALYMFLVGLEVDLGLIRRRARSAAAISWAGILVPFCLGAALALPLMRHWRLFAPAVAGWQAMLFLGAALSITAFPMLARIIYERGLSGTSLGVLALAAGALNDAAAWGLLALVLAGFTGDGSIAVLAIGGGTLYAVLMVSAGRRWLARGYAALLARPDRHSLILPVTLALVCLAAALTDALGVHAVFGAFILGACMPRGALQKRLESEIAPLTTVFLVPIFFVNSGLNTAIGLLDSWTMWGVALLLLAAAVFGKGVACAGAAWGSGADARDSIALGALMNARGLTELLLLNIAHERGLIGQTLFTMLVLMAVVTTLMAVPFLNRVYPRTVPLEDAAAERP